MTNDKKEIDEDWIARPVYFNVEDVTKNSFVGEVDADHEWTKRSQPKDLFIHTDSYTAFEDYRTVLLFGRRGTGKSCIMKYLRYEVRSRNNDSYDYCWLIDEPDTYDAISFALRGTPLTDYPDREIRSVFSRLWRWVIKTSSMQAIVWDLDQESTSSSEDRHYLEPVFEYFKEIGFVSHDYQILKEDGVRYIANKISDYIIESPSLDKVPLLFVRLIRELNSPLFKRAEEVTKKFLIYKKRKCLVLIDSVEEYGIRDKISKSNLSGLISAIYRTLGKREDTGIHAKVALPSEIFTHLDIWNEGKLDSKWLFILWRYKDLISLLAKRYYKCISDRSENSINVVKIQELDNNEAAKQFLYQHFPSKINTYHNLEMDSMYYILKHTHKTPRHYIMSINQILSMSNSINEVTEESIRMGIHKVSSSLSSDALKVFDSIYENGKRIALQTFARQKNIFTWSEIDYMLKEATQLRKKSELHNEEVKRFFLEAGIIGRLYYKSEVGDTTMYHSEFEYQVKGTITPKNNDVIVIHPMFYDTFGTLVSTNRVPNPVPYENEEKESLAEQGVILK